MKYNIEEQGDNFFINGVEIPNEIFEQEKIDLKSLLKQAKKMVDEYKGISICFQIYCDGNYILDTEEDNVIDISRTEKEAIGIIEGMKEEGCKGLYYKPILIDSITGERITRKTIDKYK